jgi:hypothetical protein
MKRKLSFTIKLIWWKGKLILLENLLTAVMLYDARIL